MTETAADLDQVQLTPAQERLLAVLRAKRQIIDREGDKYELGEQFWAEYRSLGRQGVAVFLPLIGKMMHAGLLSIEVAADHGKPFIVGADKFERIAGVPDDISEDGDGNIIISGRYVGGEKAEEEADR
jgi:hypothetical protein